MWLEDCVRMILCAKFKRVNQNSFEQGIGLALENGVLVVGSPQQTGEVVVTVQANRGSKIEAGTARTGAVTAFGVKDGAGCG